jgi:hypothetical protein
MPFHQPFQVIGFHSCDRDVGLRMLNGKDHLRPSDNPWDWLGPGIYFWEDNPYRALEYASDCAMKKQKFSGDIKNPLVLGAIIELGNCLNLIEPNSINIIKKIYTVLKSTFEVSGEQMPSNKGDNRSRDCAVIKHLHQINKRDGLPAYDSIRSPFNEGGAIYEQARFTDGQHIQICVINPNQITGYFLPRPVEKFNPWLHKDFTTLHR